MHQLWIHSKFPTILITQKHISARENMRRLTQETPEYNNRWIAHTWPRVHKHLQVNIDHQRARQPHKGE